MANFDNSVSANDAPADAARPADQQDRKRAREKNDVAGRDSRAADPGAYVLIHTLGVNTPEPHSGDGAYATWQQSYFADNLAPEGCVLADQFIYEGSKTGTDDVLERRLRKEFDRHLAELVEREDVREAPTIILNWHLRATGRPNAWSGRGLSPALLASAREASEKAGFKFRVVYTVHESQNIEPRLLADNPFPCLLALNPTVHDTLAPMEARGFTRAQSQVPSLMTSLHTTCLDRIMRYAVGSEVTAESALALRTGGACILQELRLANTRTQPDEEDRSRKGLLIFGMITARHGVSQDLMASLCSGLSEFPAEFKIAVAGRVQDRALAGQLRALADSNPRFQYLGELSENSLDSLAGYRYAVSFDQHGYRTNASAMVNVTRAGKLLFSRDGTLENDQQLIQRAVGEMKRCEGLLPGMDPGGARSRYLSRLTLQFPRVMESAGIRVGRRLDTIFRNVARDAPPLRTVRRRADSASGSGVGTSGSSSSSSAGKQ
jgi:hypothetical protein